MDDKPINENKKNKENQKSNNDTDNKTIESNTSSTKINSEQNLDLKKGENEKEEKKENLSSNENEDSNNIKEENFKKECQKDIELIKEIKKNNYKKLYQKYKFCDYRTREDKPWKYGIINEILEDSIIVQGINKEKKSQIKLDDSFKLSYFRKHSEPNNENRFESRDNKESLLKKLSALEKAIKEEDTLNNENLGDAWSVYYLLHSKIYFGLDSAMKVNENINYMYRMTSENEGVEESFRIILSILYFISKYYKYLLDNKDEFIYYENNIINKELDDLKIVNRKCAIFSFFDVSLNLLKKIFANEESYFSWFNTLDNKLKEFVPSFIDKKTKPNENYYPIYKEEEENKEEKEKKDEKESKLFLKRICLKIAYNKETTFSSDDIKIRAAYLAYFIDYFYALNGFSYLYQLSYCSNLMSIELLKKIINGLYFSKRMTDNYKYIIEEKKNLLKYIYDFFDGLNEKTIIEYKPDDTTFLINKIPTLVHTEKGEDQKIFENLYFNYISKTLLLSKKLEEKINALNTIKDILKSINSRTSAYISYRLKFEKMNIEDFCQNCKRNKILQTLFNDKNVHEEIIKRLPDIIFVMYKYNFGYTNKEEDKEKINSEKKMIFNVLFNKLFESEQNNEKLVKNIQNIICDFCKILSKEDKLYVYQEIKKYLEKSIEKKGIPMKDHLSFIIDYSLSAINNIKNKDNNEEEEKKEEIIRDKNLNRELEEENYFGINLLLNYLTEEKYKKYNMTNEQKIELINCTINGIIKIIRNMEEIDFLLKYIIFRGISMVKNSKDIIQYLILFESIKQCDEIIQCKFISILEEYSKKYGLLLALMADMSRYLLLSKNNIINNEDEKKKEGKKVYEGFFDNEKNIKLRLELIFFLLQDNLNEENLDNFKRKIINSCENNIFGNGCLYKFIHNNLKGFDLKLIQFFYENILSTKEILSNYNDIEYYKLCIEIIKKMNIINKIFYFMNNKDLALINVDSEKEIKGIDLLWNFLIKTKNKKIRNNVTDFLSDIFFGIKIKNKEKRENFWKNYIESIYNKLDEIIKLEKEENNEEQSQSIQGIISLIKKIENKFISKGEIIENLKYIKEEIRVNKNEINKKKKGENNDNNNVEKYKKIIYSGNVYGKDNILNYDVKFDDTEYFYMFRYKLSLFFKIPLNLIKLVLDKSKYDKKLNEIKSSFEFDLFNDFDNTYSLMENIEQKLNIQNNNGNGIENNLIFKVEIIKEDEKLKYIKKLLKDFPKLIKLLKRKNSEYLLDVWYLIKEDNIKVNQNTLDSIKEILNENENIEKLNSTFNFTDTNIYYISYILFHLNNAINELNKSNGKFINGIFLKSKIWHEKIKNIKLEISPKPNLGEIYEKNNVINYLLNIYKIICQKTEDNDTLIFILNKIFEYYYQTVNECISLNLKGLSSIEGIRVDLVEDLYISNTTRIKEIIIQNKKIYETLIQNLINKREENIIKNQFEFLFCEGLIKNRIFSINQKLQSFLLTIADDNILKNNKLKNDFYLYIINFFLNKKTYNIIINNIKDLALDTHLDITLNIEKYENNIILYFDIIINIIDKVYKIISSQNNKFNFKSFINEILLKNIYNPIIDGIPIELSYHQFIFGGFCQVLLHLLIKVNNNNELITYMNFDEEKKLKKYLFEEIIMNKCNKNIFTEENIDNYKSINITSPHVFKEATNLFIFLIMSNIENERDDEINYYFEKLTELHKECFWKGKEILDWKLEFKESNRLAPFVGLKNLGCTCYMNSLLQVFFNFIPFRESLLRCKCKEEKKNSLYQLKKLFYSLKYLQVNYYVPNDFPDNFDNEKLNVHQQMDVDEFFGNILDKIETRLKNTKNDNLVKYFFQGRQNDMLTFQEGCKHHRTNINNFYSIQLQIEGKKNIYESLDTLIEGELMNGDNCIFCPECNKKFPAVKSQNFKKLPRMLIFVLKRFEFNYDTMTKVKINDYYEFPLELDMSKYISEDNNKDPYLNKYKLKSVLVHMGKCEEGHYYAYIKTKNEQWYEFNDTQVRPFDIAFLKEEAYGGKEEYSSGQINEKNRSAYLLFYEKINQSDCEQFDNIEAINSFLNLNKEKGNNEITDKNGNEKEEDYEGMKDILDNINKDMYKHFLNKKLFSNEYQYFILELYLNTLNYYYGYNLPLFLMHLCRNSQNTENTREITAINSNLNSYLDKNKLILFSKQIEKNKQSCQYSKQDQILNLFKHFIIYFFNVFIRTKEKEYLGGMVDFFKFLMNDHTICANYLIEEFCNINTIVEYLIMCPLYEIKKLIVGILYCAMIKSVNEYKYYNIKNEKEKKMNKPKDKNSIKSQAIMDDEAYARQLSNDLNGGDNYMFEDNPLEYENIPKNILKMIYNILHIIREMRYSYFNEHRFLYFTIYRFSLINENTREFLINKCRLFELLCLLLHKRHATYTYDTKAIIKSTFIGPYTGNHEILNNKEKMDLNNINDKSGDYRSENYMYLLFFYLLSYIPENKSKMIVKEDFGYSLENKEFINVLLNNIRTKEDAFGFSNFINEKSKNNKNRIIQVFETLIDFLEKVDNVENKNYNYKIYNSFVDNNMNENINDDDPGINPKYLLLIIKRFIATLNIKNDYVQKGIKLIFRIFWKNQNYYSYCIMIIDFLIEIFSVYLRGYASTFKKEFEQLLGWLERNPIAPTLYSINGISLYKGEQKSYQSNLSEDKIREFEEKEIEKTRKKILKINNLLKNEIGNLNDKKEINLFDFKLIIGDVILYDNKEVVIEEALDELIKITISIDTNKRNSKIKKEMWIEIDDPKIEIKELKGKII